MNAVAVDIGGTKIAGARVSSDGTVIEPVRRVETPQSSPDSVVADVVAIARSVADARTAVVGIASAGVIDSAAGRVLAATTSIPGWQGTPIADRVASELALPTYVLGDGHAFALGESQSGAIRDASAAVVIAAGTGIGGSYVVNGQPQHGQHWAGGHLGHVAVPQADGLECYCGRTGHLEAIASGAGILRWYRENGGEHDLRGTRELFERTDRDPIAERAMTLGATALGTVSGGLVNVLDPDVVVLAGGLSRGGPSWENAVRAAYSATVVPYLTATPLVVAEPSRWSALRGAAHYAVTRESER